MKTPVGDRPFRRAWLICLSSGPRTTAAMHHWAQHSHQRPTGLLVGVSTYMYTQREGTGRETMQQPRGAHCVEPLCLFLSPSRSVLCALSRRWLRVSACWTHPTQVDRMRLATSPTILKIGEERIADTNRPTQLSNGLRCASGPSDGPTLLALAQRAGRAAWDHRVQARSPLPTWVAAMRARRTARLSRSPTATHCWDHGACDCPGNDNENDNDTLREVRHPSMKAWPHRQECRGHDPAKKNMLR